MIATNHTMNPAPDCLHETKWPIFNGHFALSLEWTKLNRKLIQQHCHSVRRKRSLRNLGRATSHRGFAIFA